MRCFRVLPGDTLRLERDRADREATTGRTGEFRLRYLPSKNARFVVVAFRDDNNNRVYDAETDPGIIYPDTLVITPGAPLLDGVEIVLIDPKEPGKVGGSVANESGADTARVMVAMFAEADTTRPAYRAVCDSTGAYAIRSVKPGGYVLWAFVDVNPDSLPGVYPCAALPKGCPEPSVRRAGTLRVGPAAEVTEPPLVIRRKEEPRAFSTRHMCCTESPATASAH